MIFNYKTIIENLKSKMKYHLNSKMGAISKIMTFLLKYMMDFGFFGKRIQKTLLHSLNYGFLQSFHVLDDKYYKEMLVKLFPNHDQIKNDQI